MPDDQENRIEPKLGDASDKKQNDSSYYCGQCGIKGDNLTSSFCPKTRRGIHDIRKVPALGDSSDASISLAGGARIHGWTVPEWIEAIERAPDRSLPNGVGGAIVQYYKAKLAAADEAIREIDPHVWQQMQEENGRGS